MNNDLISRSALLEKAWDADTRCGYVQVVDVGDIEEAIAVDAVEVVRCKDCKFIINREDRTHGCYRHFVEDCKPDDFCSYGERK